MAVESGHDEQLLALHLFGHDMGVVVFHAPGCGDEVFVELVVLEVDHQQSVPTRQLAEVGQLAVEALGVAEVGIEDEQRALGKVLLDALNQGRVVGLSEVGMHGIEAVLDALHLRGAVGGRQKGVHTLVEGDESGAVFTVYRHIGQHQRGIDGIVE